MTICWPFPGRGAHLTECVTENTIFDGCRFDLASLGASTHRNSQFLNCSFSATTLFGTAFLECKLTGSGFPEAQLSAVTIEGGDWSFTMLDDHFFGGQNLRGVKFTEASLQRCDLRKADLREADLTGALLAGAQLEGADLRGARLERVDLRNINWKRVHIDLEQALAVARALGAIVDAPE